eukprot:216284-Prymnesium_polylepis.1
MVLEARDELAQALKADLNKSPEQAYLTELNMVEKEVQNALDHLEDWCAPTAVGTDVGNMLALGRSELVAEPLGVV